MSDTSTDDDIQTVRVEGELDKNSVPGRLKKSANWFSAGHETVIDLGGVVRADSAGVALLLEWMRDARRAGTTLRFANAPAQMRAIIDFSGLGDVIDVSGRT
ncbi:lipid asymmetry maintenance protein MlaB [Salinisphaera sp. Q1T1-3]|uniref:STAS domain-containing protein n=1 Tax=Salinisphaera sp. Q1T1-3 TaxID=2321229 RepID=UPI000ECEEACE|nr:STAS domain-containing protein [Salinisphaera sp. Q1T1-3]RJS94633.1 STAS domain-containing protein [Salinisphaera sp. Q1T1-3]